MSAFLKFVLVAATAIVAAGSLVVADSSFHLINESPRAAKARDLRIEKFTWHAGGFGRVAVATFTVRSTANLPLDDVEFSCVTYGKSGIALSRLAQTVYDTVPAHAAKIFKDVNLGLIDAQSDEMVCVIAGAS